MQVIIYQTDDGVAVITPAPGFDVATVAAKDVPAGAAFRMIDAADLPDRASRDRWRWTEAGPLDVAPQ